MNRKLAIVIGVCFGLGAGSGATWTKRKAEAAGHAELQAATDSTAATAPGARHGEADTPELQHPPTPVVAGVTIAPADTAQETGGHDAPTPEDVQTTTSADTMPPPGAPPADTAHTAPLEPDSAGAGAKEDEGRSSRIFGAMRPEEAARILEGLDDRAALGVLLGLTDRKAAAILANIKGERATALARALLNHEGNR